MSPDTQESSGPQGCIFCVCLTAVGSTISHMDDGMCNYGLPQGIKCSGSPVEAKVFSPHLLWSAAAHRLSLSLSASLALWGLGWAKHWDSECPLFYVTFGSRFPFLPDSQPWTKSMGLLWGGPARGCVTLSLSFFICYMRKITFTPLLP